MLILELSWWQSLLLLKSSWVIMAGQKRFAPIFIRMCIHWQPGGVVSHCRQQRQLDGCKSDMDSASGAVRRLFGSHGYSNGQQNSQAFFWTWIPFRAIAGLLLPHSLNECDQNGGNTQIRQYSDSAAHRFGTRHYWHLVSLASMCNRGPWPHPYKPQTKMTKVTLSAAQLKSIAGAKGKPPKRP